MHFEPPLERGILVRRYQRFLADIALPGGNIITVHCPNTGSMLSCSTPGSEVGFSESGNPRRKYPHTLEIVKDGTTWVGVNTGRTNSLVEEGVQRGIICEFADADAVRREVTVAKGARLDMVVTRGARDTYIEIKNCSLVASRVAMFPDAVTARGAKHLDELVRLAGEGHGACILFLVQRADAESFSPAAHIDPGYAEKLRKSTRRGVTALAYRALVSPHGIDIDRRLPIRL